MSIPTSREDAGTVSYCYLVDLAGLVSTDNTAFHKLPEQEKITSRSTNLQLQCLLKVLGEMRALSTAAATNSLTPAQAALTAVRTLQQQQQHSAASKHPSKQATSSNYSLSTNAASIMKMTSARDSKLTTILAPIIQGNVKTSLMLFLDDGEAHAQEVYSLLNSLNGVTDIISACLRMKVRNLE